MVEKKFRRVVVVAPTRSTCLNISMVLSNGAIPSTLLMQERGEEIFEAVSCLDVGGFGVVAGTGTGKTVAIRDIARRVVGESLSVDVVTREHEATEQTWQCNTLVVTPGVAFNWLKSNVLSSDDLLVFDEIHQTSDHLELTLALAKRAGCTFVWMSATIDPTLYLKYLNAATVIECSAFDPSKRAEVELLRQEPQQFFSDERLNEFIAGERAVAVFVPTRMMAERLSNEYGKKEGLHCDFYHGGEKAEKLRQFLKGDVPKPFMVFMTIAGASSLNILGLDTVVIMDEMFKEVVHSGVSVLEKVQLGSNELLQMGGRVNGRMENSRIYILGSREIDFHNLKPTIPEFVLGGDLQRVALTCAKLGVNASELDLISPINRDAYSAQVERFRGRGIIEMNSESLTPYGKEVERLPVDPGWAELIVKKEKEGNGIQNVVVVCSCIESLYSMLRKSPNLQGLGVSGSDHLTAHNIVVSALRQFGFVQGANGGAEYGLRGDWVKNHFDQKTGQSKKSMGEFTQWCDFMGFNGKAIKEVLIAVKSVFRQLGKDLPEPVELQLVDNNDQLHLSFVDLLAQIQSLDFVHDQQNSKAMSAYSTVWAAQSSMTRAFRVLGKIRYWNDKQRIRRATVEGTEIPLELISLYGKKNPQSVTRVTDQGVEIKFNIIFAEEYLGDMNITVLDHEIPENLLVQAEMKFVESFADGDIQEINRCILARNAEIRGIAEELWVRSGGVSRRITQNDEVKLYRSVLEGKEVFSMKTLNKAIQDGKINPLDFFLKPISEEEQVKIKADNPDAIEVLGMKFPVTYREGNSPQIVFEDGLVKNSLWYRLPDGGIKLPNGRLIEVKIVVIPGWYGKSFSDTNIPALKKEVISYFNANVWSDWKCPENIIPDLAVESAFIPEIKVREYGKCVVTGLPLWAHGVVGVKSNRYYDSDPWFEVIWTRSREDAERHYEAAVRKLSEIRVEEARKRKLAEVKAEAETVNRKVCELYHHSDNGRLERDLMDKLSRVYSKYDYLSSNVEDFQSWTIEAEEVCVQVEAAYVNIQRKREERKNVQIPERLIEAFSGDEDRAYDFMQKVAALSWIDPHIINNCGREKNRKHLFEVSGDADFFLGSDPNAVAFYVRETYEAKKLAKSLPLSSGVVNANGLGSFAAAFAKASSGRK